MSLARDTPQRATDQHTHTTVPAPHTTRTGGTTRTSVAPLAVHKRQTNFASPARRKPSTAEDRKAAHQRLLKMADEQREGYILAGRSAKRVADCGEVPVIKDTVAFGVAGGSLRFTGMRSCDNRACPTCGEVKMVQDRALVEAAITIADQMGLIPFMATLTAAHVTAEAIRLARGDMRRAVEIQSVAGIVERTNKAWRKLTSGKGAGSVKSMWRDYVRAREVTLDNLLVLEKRTGVHHHFHVLIFVNPADYLGEEHDGVQVPGGWSWAEQENRRRIAAHNSEREFIPREAPHPAVEAAGRKLWRGWSKACRAVGLSTDRKGFDVVQVDAKRPKDAAEYLVKGEKAASAAAAEVTGGQLKDARLARRIAPEALLRNIARTPEGDAQDGLMAQWREYEAAVKGLQWVRFGDGGLKTLAAEMVAEQDEDDTLTDDDRLAVVSHTAIADRVDELRVRVNTTSDTDKFAHLTDTLDGWGIAYRVVTVAEWADMTRDGYRDAEVDYQPAEYDWDAEADALVDRLFSKPMIPSRGRFSDPPF